MDATFRPLEGWPKPGFEPYRPRVTSRFRSTWGQTLELLRYELGRLGAEAVVIRLALGDDDIRRDGYPKANARPKHPGVVVEWQIAGRWNLASAEKYDSWQHNAHAIARTLEDLRGAERHEVVSGEQFQGFRLELPSGHPMPAGGFARASDAQNGSVAPQLTMTAEEAADFLAEHGGLVVFEYPVLRDSIEHAYRHASKRLHPDAGGDEQEFQRLQEARDVLLKGGR